MINSEERIINLIAMCCIIFACKPSCAYGQVEISISVDSIIRYDEFLIASATFYNPTDSIVVVGIDPEELAITQYVRGNKTVSQSISQPVVVPPKDSVTQQYDITESAYNTDSLSQFQVRLEYNREAYTIVDSIVSLTHNGAWSNTATVTVIAHENHSEYQAFNNAAITDLITTGDPGTAISAYAEFLTNFPTSSLSTVVRSRLLTLYFAQGNEEAASAVAKLLIEHGELPELKSAFAKYAYLRPMLKQ